MVPTVLLGATACGHREAASSEGTATNLAAIEQRIDAAAALTERLQAVRAVKRLQYAYGHYSEVGLWHDFADLFSDNAIGHYTQGDLGKEQIRKLFVEEVGQGIVGLAEGRIYPHIALSPVVTLAPDGQSAKARWRIVAMLGGYGRSALWARGVYENVYVKERGAWKVQEITFYNQVSGRYGDSLHPTVKGPLDAPTLAFHYSPAEVGAPLVPAAAESTGTDAHSGFAALAKRMSELEAQARRLTDENSVLNLQNAYGYYVDRKLWDDVADLFADDGTLELGQGGVYVGKASIRRGLDQLGPAGLRYGEVNDYIQMQPVVTVAPDGATAKARGVYLGMTGQVGVGAQWREGIYENAYVHDAGVWKINSVHVYPRLVTDYDKGWALDAEPVNGPSETFPPDRPPTSAYESYPKFVIPPLHFRHPVTGRSPQYAEGYAGGDPSVAAEAPRPAVPAGTVQELEGKVARIEQELRAAAATEAAENLLNAYGYYADEHLWNAAAELFTLNGWAEVPGVGAYEGREHLRAAWQTVFGGRLEGVFALHQIAQPVIHPSADGSATRIRARLARIDASEAGDDAYIAGVYEASVREEQGLFRIAALDFVPTWAASHSRGWARVTEGEAAALLAPPSSGAPPPDRPEPVFRFPALDDVPFHYANPVSNRAPARSSF
jgi:hypothetical protein